MALKNLIFTAIQACANAAFADDEVGTPTSRGALRLGFGTPGQRFQFRGEVREAGRSYVRPGSIDCMLEGLGNSIGRRPSVTVKNKVGNDVDAGTCMRVSGNSEVKRASSTTPEGFIGCALEDIEDDEFGEVGIAGSVPVLLVTGSTPLAGELVALSATAGQAEVTVVEANAFGTILDITGYADPSNRIVMAVLATRPRA